MCLQFPSSQPSSVVVFCLATDHNNTAAQYQNTDCFCQHSMDHQYPGWWQLSSLQSDVMWRWLPSGTNMVTCHLTLAPVNSVTCHVWSPAHWDSGTAWTLPPHIFTYLHISPRLRCQCCSLTFSSFYTDQETFDPSLQSPGRHAALQHFQYNGEY